MISPGKVHCVWFSACIDSENGQPKRGSANIVLPDDMPPELHRRLIRVNTYSLMLDQDIPVSALQTSGVFAIG